MGNTKDLYPSQQDAFNELIAKTFIDFEDNATKLRAYSNFWQNNTIQSLRFPNVTTIATHHVISNCSKLQSIDFGKKLDFYVETSSDYKNFNNCPSLAHLILRSPTKCTISTSSSYPDYKYDLLKNTPIEYKHGAIYVPSNLVNQYKNDMYWQKYLIFPISEDPQNIFLETFDTIKEDWSTIIDQCNNGTFNYNIGDSKVIQIKGATYYAELVGKNIDYIVTPETHERIIPAATSWILRDLYSDKRVFSDNDNKNWETSNLRNYLNNNTEGFLADLTVGNPKLVSEEGIKLVEKTTYGGASNLTNLKTADKIWIPSIQQIVGSNEFETEGPTYSDWFLLHKYNRIKYITNNNPSQSLTKGTAMTYWTRTKTNNTGIGGITTAGAIGRNYNRSNQFPYCIGFCI